MARRRVVTKEWRKLLLTGVAAILLLGVLLKTSASNTPTSTTSAAKQSLGGIAVIGNSFADEYRADDQRGGRYASGTLNWVELLSKYRGIDFGTYGNWGGVRRTGYEYNFSRSGITSGSMLRSGSPEILAQYIAAGKIDLLYYQLGTNDFDSENAPFVQIYEGKLAGEMLDTYLTGVFSNMTTTIALANSSHKAKVLLGLVADPTLTSRTRKKYADPIRLKRVSSAIERLNHQLRTYASSRGYAIMDLSSLPIPANSTSGDDPRNYFLADGIHPGTIASATFANLWLQRVAELTKIQVAPFKESELSRITKLR